MTGFLLTVHVLVAAALIGIILLQRSDGGALGGIGGGADPLGGVMSQRGSANLLTRATSILAVVFMTLSLLLAVLASRRGAEDLPLLLPAEGEQGIGGGILEPAPPTGDAPPVVVVPAAPAGDGEPAPPAGGAPSITVVPVEPAGDGEPAPPAGEAPSITVVPVGPAGDGEPAPPTGE